MPFTTCTRFICYCLKKRKYCVTFQRSGTALNCKRFVYLQKYIAPYLFGKKKSKLDLLEEAIAELKTNSEATLTSVRELQQQQQRSVAMNAWSSGRVQLKCVIAINKEHCKGGAVEEFLPQTQLQLVKSLLISADCSHTKTTVTPEHWTDSMWRRLRVKLSHLRPSCLRREFYSIGFK